MTTFYRVDGGRLTYGEYWRMAPSPLAFLIAAGRKFLGSPLQFQFAIPRPDRLFLVEFEEFPGYAKRAMTPAIQAVEREGLRLVFCHRIAVPEPNRLGVAAHFLDPKNHASLGILFGRTGEHIELRISCASGMSDDSLAVTTTMKQTLNPVPGQSIVRKPGADADEIYRLHCEHLARLDREGLLPKKLNPDRLDEFVLGWELNYVDHHIARGVFVPMTDEELDEVSRE